MNEADSMEVKQESSRTCPQLAYTLTDSTFTLTTGYSRASVHRRANNIGQGIMVEQVLNEKTYKGRKLGLDRQT